MQWHPEFDVFLCYCRHDDKWVTSLAKRLEDESHLKVWLDLWQLIPGVGWQQQVIQGLEKSASCAVCFGAQTSRSWFDNEIQYALELQKKNERFRASFMAHE